MKTWEKIIQKRIKWYQSRASWWTEQAQEAENEEARMTYYKYAKKYDKFVAELVKILQDIREQKLLKSRKKATNQSDCEAIDRELRELRSG